MNVIIQKVLGFFFYDRVIRFHIIFFFPIKLFFLDIGVVLVFPPTLGVMEGEGKDSATPGSASALHCCLTRSRSLKHFASLENGHHKPPSQDNIKDLCGHQNMF